jgi:glycosyltransferase involved in cell wall biosynthesis
MLGELLALEKSGSLAALFATKPGENGAWQPGSERLLSYLQVLPEGTASQQASVIASTLRREAVAAVHGYFAHKPAEVAAEAAASLGLPYGFSVHARDARKVEPTALAERARKAACVVACNPDVAHEIEQTGARIHLLPHGVDLQRFQPQTCEASGPLRVLAVGRLVEKKGFHILLAALSAVTAPFSLRIVGDGPERERLLHLIEINSLKDRVTLGDSMTHAELPEIYAQSDVVVVPSILDRSGDRDGLPNVVLEAMACARAVVASDISAIGTAVTNEVTGLLVPPTDPLALAAAIDRLSGNPDFRFSLGWGGRERVERDYEVGQCTQRFQQVLTSVYV